MVFVFSVICNYSEFNNGKRFVGNIYTSSNEAVIVNFDNDEITLTIRDVDGEVYHVSKKITVDDFYNVKILNEGPTPTSHKTDRGLCHIGLVFDADEKMAIVINGSECATININASDVDFSFKEHQLYRDVETVDVPLLLEDVMLYSGVLTVGQINSFMRFSNWPYHGSTFTD